MTSINKILDRLYAYLNTLDLPTLQALYDNSQEECFWDIKFTLIVVKNEVISLKSRELFNFNMLKGRSLRLVGILKVITLDPELELIGMSLEDYFKYTNRMHWNNISDVMDLLA